MKIDALREYITNTIRNEIRLLLKEELKLQLAEILLGNSNTTNRQQSQKTESVVLKNGNEPVKQKKYVKYTDNPVLNEVLNQTTGGIPREGEMVGLLKDESHINNREQINEVKVPENAPESVKVVYSALNRDYSSLMKAVDKKKSKR